MIFRGFRIFRSVVVIIRIFRRVRVRIFIRHLDIVAIVAVVGIVSGLFVRFLLILYACVVLFVTDQTFVAGLVRIAPAVKLSLFLAALFRVCVTLRFRRVGSVVNRVACVVGRIGNVTVILAGIFVADSVFVCNLSLVTVGFRFFR